MRSSEANPPPFVPELDHDADTTYFEDVETFHVPLPGSDGPEDIVVESEGPDLSFAIQPRRFVGFTFKRIVRKGKDEESNVDISMNVRFDEHDGGIDHKMVEQDGLRLPIDGEKKVDDID